MNKMIARGYSKTKHSGIFYWIKTCIDGNGEKFISMVQCKEQK